MRSQPIRYLGQGLLCVPPVLPFAKAVTPGKMVPATNNTRTTSRMSIRNRSGFSTNDKLILLIEPYGKAGRREARRGDKRCPGRLDSRGANGDPSITCGAGSLRRRI